MSYPIKNWVDESQYPAPNQKSLSRAQWAWEFLRRRTDYQGLWEIFESFPDAMEVNGYSTNKIGKWRGSPWEGARFQIDWWGWAEPAPIKGETLDQYHERCPEGVALPFAEFLGWKFKAEGADFYSPLDDNPKYLFSDPKDGDPETPPWIHQPESYWGDQSSLFLMADKPDEAPFHLFRKFIYPAFPTEDEEMGYRYAVEFDLRFKLRPQLKKAEEDLKLFMEMAKDDGFFEQRKRTNPQQAKYPKYLRVLDALLSNVAPEEIRSTLYPDLSIEDFRKSLKTIKEEYWRTIAF